MRTISGKAYIAPRVRGEIKRPRVVEPRGRIRLDIEKVPVRDDQLVVDRRRAVRVPRVGQRCCVKRERCDLLPASCVGGRAHAIKGKGMAH
jgi:hypothetical protein